MGVIRTFIAIRLPGEIDRALGKLADGMRPAWPERSVRWAKAENIHLTLRFLGDMESVRIGEIRDGLVGVVLGHEAFRLALSGSGCFPNECRPRVVWTGVDDEAGRLASLQSDIEGLVRALGCEPEKRDYRPHLTLGRVKHGVKPPQENWLEDPPALAFEVGAVELIESALKPGGAEYRTLYRAALSGRGV